LRPKPCARPKPTSCWPGSRTSAATLNSKSFLSQQQLDESVASLAKAQADLDGKRAQSAVARAGSTGGGAPPR
jgi:multidrug resistance efflux pump